MALKRFHDECLNEQDPGDSLGHECSSAVAEPKSSIIKRCCNNPEAWERRRLKMVQWSLSQMITLVDDDAPDLVVTGGCGRSGGAACCQVCPRPLRHECKVQGNRDKGARPHAK